MFSSSITQKLLLSWGGEAVYRQAEQLVRGGLVKKAEMKDGLVSGVIARESGADVRTRFRLLPDGTIENLCPCFASQHEGRVCPHAVALGLLLMLRRSSPERERAYQEELRRARRVEAVDAADYVARSERGLPARIALSFPASWAGDFYRGEVACGLRFAAAGGRLLAPEDLGRGAALALSPDDDALLSVLEDICEGPPPGTFGAAPADFLNVLDVSRHLRPEIAGLGRAEIRAEAADAALRAALDRETGELVLSPLARAPGAEEGGPRPVFLVSGRRGYVFAAGRFWPLKSVLPGPYQSLYRKEERIPRESVIAFLDGELGELRRAMPVETDPPPDLFVREPGRPVFHLEVRGSRASLRATLRAAYGGKTAPAGIVTAADNFALPDPDDILRYTVRNLPAERAALELLRASAGFRPELNACVLTGTREVLNFLGSGYPALARRGWKVSFAGGIAAWAESLRSVTPVVQVARRPGGWFDVGFTFDDPVSGAVPPAEVQRAINRGDSFLQRGGETVLLDKGAVEAMRAIFDDCQSRESPTPGHFLLPDVYAPFVQASLNAMDGIDVEDPPDWREDAARRNRRGGARLEPVPLGRLETTLRPYQKDGVYWLRFLEGAGLCGLLADEMGLGKTLQTLCWLSLRRIREDARGKPALVVCPTSLVANWAREARAFVPDMKCLVLSGPGRKALFPQIPAHDLVITSYALIRRDQDDYAPFTFSAAVLDEAQHIKNRSTRNARAAKRINALSKLVLTGTPVENSVADIWSIMDFLMPGYLGPYDLFRANYEEPIAAAGPEGAAAQEKLRRKLHPFLLRRLKKEVARDLPDKISRIAYCPLSPDQRRVYDGLLSDSRRRIGDMVGARGFEKSRFEILALLMRLRQACCHLDLLKDHHAPGAYAAPSAKTDTFLELLDEAVDGGHRVLVFSQFVKMLTLLRSALEARGMPYCYLDGATKDRLEQCRRFNLTPSIPVFLISLKAGGTGLNLTGADMVVHFDPWWNPAVEDQATDRAHRIGQKKTVYSVKLIAEDTVEEKVLAMQKKKQRVIDATVGATDQAIMSRLTFDDIRGLVGM